MWKKNHTQKRNAGIEILFSEMEDILSVPQTDTEYELEEITPIINKWLLTLSKKERALFILRYWQGESVKSIAKQWNTSANKLSGKLFRLRKSLKQVLEMEDIFLWKKSNNEILYNSISNIDESIIASSLVYKPKSKKIIICASLAACLCAVSVTNIVIYKSNFNKPANTCEVLSTTNSSSDFHIYSLPKVLSENSEISKQKVLLSPIKTLLDGNTGIHTITYTVNFKSDGSPYDERDTSYSGNIIKQDLFDISPDGIEFSIVSDAVEYYNVTVKNNCISYQSDSTVFSGQSKSFENIKISDNCFITWQPTCEKFTTEILSITGKKEPDYDSNIQDRTEYSNTVKAVYDSIKNFDEYFGDTLTFELHYKNNTTKTVYIYISINESGNYMVNYS